MLEFFYIVESYIAVGLAVNKANAYRILICCYRGKDEFFTSKTLEFPSAFSLQKFCHGNLAYSAALVYQDEPSLFFVFVYCKFQAIILPVIVIQYLILVGIHQTDDGSNWAVTVFIIMQGIVAQT